jgi:NAD(P)-dependent dehydrogenase (short-subunit alcohol dehydrogenase family)
MEITGKRVLITGGNRGLGRSIALACKRAGAAELFAGTRSFGRLLDEGLTPVELDVTSDSSVAAAARKVGRVDILINNAGIAIFGGVLKASFDEIQREMDINYLGVLRVVRAFAPAMVEHGDGVIVNVASQLAKVNLPAAGTYCATKAALLSLSQAMRGDLEYRGVRVIAVLPGTMDTDMTRGLVGAKLSPDIAADEILEAIRGEKYETAIGDEARRLISDVAADPRAVEKRFSSMRA